MKKHSRFNKAKEEIRARFDWPTYLRSKGIPFQEAGNTLKTLSPFNPGDSDPSCVFWLDSKNWQDFSGGGGDGGDPFDFIIKLENLKGKGKFIQALRILAKFTGVEIPDHNRGDWEKAAALEEEARQVRAVQLIAAEYYRSLLTQEIRKKWYHEHYHFSDAIIDELGLGYTDGRLHEHLLKTKGIPRELALKTGLLKIVRADQISAAAQGRLDEFFDGGLIEDHFEAGRLIFPHWHDGMPVYFGARTTDPACEKETKYLKTLTHSAAHPYVSATVKNCLFAAGPLRGAKVITIPEGYPDAASVADAGYAVISPCTTRITSRDIELVVEMTRGADKVIIVNDSEQNNSGIRGALSTARALHAAEVPVFIAEIPRPEGIEKIDANEYLKDHTVAEFQIVLDRARSYVDYLIESVPDDTSPLDLENRLAPTMEAIAVLSDLKSEHFVKVIAKRHKLKKGLVEGLLLKAIEKVEAERKAKAAAEARAESEENDGDQDDPAGNANAGNASAPGSTTTPAPDEPLPWEEANPVTATGKEKHLRGSVNEDVKHRCYFIEEKPERGEDGETHHKRESVSNFIYIPRLRLFSKTGEIFRGDVILDNGKVHRDVTFRVSDFNSSRTLRAAFPNADLSWTGRDDHVHGLLNVLSRKAIPTLQAVEVIGHCDTPDGPVYVTPSGIITADDPEPFVEHVLVAPGSPLAKKVRYGMAPRREARALAQRALSDVLRVNEIQVVAPIWGWFAATVFRPRFMKMIGHFPLLGVTGTRACGKTSMIKYVFLPLFGVPPTDLFSVSDTEFAMLKLFTCTNSTPVVQDEFRVDDLDPRKIAMLYRYWRRLYTGETVLRGRPDLTTVEFELSAPVAFLGECRPENDSALLDRLVMATPGADSIEEHQEFQAAFGRLHDLPLWDLAGWWIRFALGRDLRSGFELALRETDGALDTISKGNAVTPRMRENLAVAVFGLRSYFAFAGEMGVVGLPHVPARDIIASSVEELVDSEHGARSELDRFVETCSILALRDGNAGGLVQGRDYQVVGEKLYLHLPSAWALYREHLKRTGQAVPPEEGRKALRRLTKENLKRDGYVIQIDRTVDMGPDHRPRTVVIDLNRAAQSLVIDGYPRPKLHSVRDVASEPAPPFQKGVYCAS